MSINPWATEETHGIPPMLKACRGDWFCMPFGGNDRAYRREQYPPHGETANNNWTVVEAANSKGRHTLHLAMQTKIRKGRIDKFVMLVDGHPAVYQRHVLSGYRGPMNFGHHATLEFPDREGAGLISTSPFVFGQVFPGEFEAARNFGYTSLKPGATFVSLDNVPTANGGAADLTKYPARRGYEDLCMIVADNARPFSWTAVSFPEERYVWFALKDPKVLASTIFWISNGGRHYAPWNGRHLNRLALEEVTAYFHYGIAESAHHNPVNEIGYKTAINLSPREPTVVNYIMAAVPVPRGFDRVASIDAEGRGVVVTCDSGKRVAVPVELDFLGAPMVATGAAPQALAE